MIFESNPWWKNRHVPPLLQGQKRPILTAIQDAMPHRQIVMITGLRRTGKSTIIYQLIQSLLEAGTPETHLFYFSFDRQEADLDTLLKQYSVDVLAKPLDEVRATLFLDEIQKVPDWENRIKSIYDRYPALKLVISGSAQLTMLDKSKESLAGRFFEFRIQPADFAEYLMFQKKEIPENKETAFETELKIAFKAYLNTGGFIDCFSLPPTLQTHYFRESILDQVIYRDIPTIWPMRQPDAARSIVYALSHYVGLYADFKSLANDLNLDQRTVAAYVDYLEKSLLIQKCYNFSKNQLTSEKKLKRLYTANVGFSKALNPNLTFPELCEQYFVNTLQAHYFYRSPKKEEVDIVLTHPSSMALPIEVKIRQNVTEKEIASLRRFMKQFNCPNGLIITKETDTQFSTHEGTITAIPYWRYHRIRRYIQQHHPPI